jgi:sugar lactone lactonase YvrE
MGTMHQTTLRASAALLALALGACSSAASGLPAASPANRPGPAKAAPTTTLIVTNFTGVTAYDSASGARQALALEGVVFPVPVAFDLSGNLFVGNTSGRHGKGSISEYAPGSSAPSRTIEAGVDDPFWLAVDSAGTLYCANQFASTVTIYPPGATKPSLTISNGVSVPVAVAVDAANDVFVANTSGSGSVTEYAPGGTAPIRTIAAGVNLPLSIALDEKGDLFVGNYAGHGVTEYPPGATSPSRTLDRGKTPVALALDSKSDLYVAAYGKQGVGEYDPSGKLLRTVTAGINYPHSIVVAPGNELVVANYGKGHEAGSVTTYAAASTKVERTITDGIVSPLDMALAPVLSIHP